MKEREGKWHCLLWSYDNMNMNIMQKKSSQNLKLTMKMNVDT